MAKEDEGEGKAGDACILESSLYAICFKESGRACWALQDTYQRFLKMTKQEESKIEKGGRTT